jgi:hypothetical protein
MAPHIWRKTLYCTLSFFLLAATAHANVEPESVRNIGFYVQQSRVYVSYDLQGKGEYTVTLLLVNAAVKPRSLSGDVGERVKPGEGKQIIWDVLLDTEQIEGDNLIFEIRAVRSARSHKWIWGAAATGLLTALVISSSAQDKGTITINIADPDQ